MPRVSFSVRRALDSVEYADTTIGQFARDIAHGLSLVHPNMEFAVIRFSDAGPTEVWEYWLNGKMTLTEGRRI